MNTEHNILQSIITEKASNMQANKQYTFLVLKESSKTNVKTAIKKIFGVEVESVKTSILPKKTRIIGKQRVWIKRPAFKKAIVTLKAGKTIDPNKIKSLKEKTK